jgi:hypothetical protein
LTVFASVTSLKESSLSDDFHSPRGDGPSLVSWRLLFLGNQASQSLISGNLANQLSSFGAAASFVFVNGGYELLVFAIIYGIYRLVQFLILTFNKTNLKAPNWLMPVLSPLTFVFAVLAVVLPKLL